MLPGAFPTELGNSAASYGADRPAIVASYGPATENALAAFGATLYGKMVKYNTDAQELADAVSRLIAMPDGTRPFQTSVNRLTANSEREYAAAKLWHKPTWMEQMG